MNRLCFILCLLIVFQGMPLAAPANDMPDVFMMPAGQVSEAYEADIEAVLREKYRLKLETASSMTVFRWTLDEGELPPGLSVSADGKITGTFKPQKAETYRFRVRVLDLAQQGGDVLVLELGISVRPPRIRLTSLDAAPRLTPVSATEGARASSRTTIAESGDALEGTSASAHASSRPRPTRATAASTMARASMPLNQQSPQQQQQQQQRRPRPAREARQAGDAQPRMAEGAACDETSLPAAHKPSTPDGAGVYRLDARNGNLFDTTTNRVITSQQRIKDRGETVRIIIDHMNPYLYTYTYNSTRVGVQEQEIGLFLKLIGGAVGDILSADASPERIEAGTAPNPPAPGGQESATARQNRQKAREKADACADARDQIEKLNNLQEDIEVRRAAIEGRLREMRANSINLTSAYTSARIPLYTLNRTRPQLYCDSVAFMTATDAGTSPGGDEYISPVEIEQLRDDLDVIRRDAARLEEAIQEFRELFPDCAKQTDIALRLRAFISYAKGVQARVEDYLKVLKKIEDDLAVVVAGRSIVSRVLGNNHAFVDERAEGNREETTVVTVTFDATPRAGVTEAVAVPANPFKPEFKFGEAPYFTISGGVAFSGLRKKEFVRVQGFERNREGKLVLVDEKPNLTTVVGLKESSPTRITPVVFLNGRIPGIGPFGPVDAVHISLGITAKSGDGGTDIEYLIGPSLGLFENKMFFTVGGYAGRQQKLEGDLFEGVAVPSTVDELPIRKDYRWNLGFALSYRIPGLSK